MDLATYIANFPDSHQASPELLEDPQFRESIYRRLHPSPAVASRPLVLALFRREADYRADPANDGRYFENLYWTALFLFQWGELDDVLPMWDAKHINMDTGGGFDIQFLVGAGVAETIAYCQNLGTPTANAAAKYLNACRDAGDFDDLDSWLAERIRYFGEE